MDLDNLEVKVRPQMFSDAVDVFTKKILWDVFSGLKLVKNRKEIFLKSPDASI